MTVAVVSIHICPILDDLALVIEAHNHDVLVDKFLACNVVSMSN